jgi:L-threonylcarbamoyladenylate synthase
MHKIVNEQEALQILLSGGVVALPTETVYGLACVAENPSAVDRIYDIKQRPKDNPLICHFHSIEQIAFYVSTLNNIERTLIEHFCPGPVSFLLPLKLDSPLLPATGGRNSVVARIPAHPMFLSILRQINKPLAAPSANTSGRYSAVNATMVLQDIGEHIDGLLDGGECVNGIESTIIQVQNNEVIILRPGVIGPEEIVYALATAGISAVVKYGNAAETTPGAKYKHYAPNTPLLEINNLDHFTLKDKEMLITVDEHVNSFSTDKCISLGSLYNGKKIAANLYKTMFLLDQLNVDKAFVYLPQIADLHWDTSIRNRLNKMIHFSVNNLAN